MTNEEFKVFVDPSVITWESVKQVLLAKDSIFYTINGNPTLDDNIILESALLISPPIGTSALNPFTYVLDQNEFCILISSSYSTARNGVTGTNIIGNIVFLGSSTNGSIFTTAFNATEYIGESYTFLLFRVN
jgi:hypothetical protein